jgi:hypothetical protein
MNNFYKSIFNIKQQNTLVQIGPRSIYKYLFVSDSIYLILILPSYISFAFNWDITVANSISCKLFWYFNYSLAAVSPMLLAYISLERVISIKYPAKKHLMRKNEIQFRFLLIVAIANLVFYMPIPIYIDTRFLSTNITNQSVIQCKFKEKYLAKAINYIDMSNRAILPFCYMLIGTVILIHSIFKTRKRIVKNFLCEESKTFHREIRLALSSILLNVVYIVMQLPISLFDLMPGIYNDISYTFVYYVFFSSYSVNFYLLIFSNKLFHDEFWKIF